MLKHGKRNCREPKGGKKEKHKRVPGERESKRERENYQIQLAID